MPQRFPTYGESSRQPAHRSFFRRALERRARPASAGQDPVHEYLIDQANLRGFFGAFSNRDDLGELDPDLSLEAIVVGLLQPHAPAEPRVVKLVVRILQSDKVDPERLLLLGRRERALPAIAWILDLLPASERNQATLALEQRLRRKPSRDPRRPRVTYDARRLERRAAHR